jgi:hypothetical protein
LISNEEGKKIWEMEQKKEGVNPMEYEEEESQN